MSFFTRLQGVFFNPQFTLKAISEKPIWVDTLIITLILLTILSAFIVPIAQKEGLQDMKNNVELRERMGEERFQQRIDFMENPPKWYFFLTAIIMPIIAHLIGYLLPSLIILGMGRMFSTEGNYKQVFSVYLHASLIDRIFGNVVRLTLILIRKSVIQTTTSLALFFPKLETSSSGYKVLSQFDFFQLWFYGILGYGLSAIFKIELKKALVISYGFWLIKSLLYIVLGLLFPQSM